MTVGQRKIVLARRLADKVLPVQTLRKIVVLVWKPEEDKFKALVTALPAAQQKLAISDFENARDETFGAREAMESVTFADSIVSQMDLETIKAWLDFYDTPPGQKSLATPAALTPEEKLTMGKLALAQPEMLQFLSATADFTVKAIHVALTLLFHTRLCDMLTNDNIRDTKCPLPNRNVR